MLALLAAANAIAQDKSLCSLLTASDVAAVGATGQGIEASLPYNNGPNGSGTMKMCNWRMANGGIHLMVVKVPPNASREQLKAVLNQSLATLKAKGWAEEKKDFGDIACSLMTPPAKEQDAPLTTGCVTETKGMAISIGTLSRTRVPMEKVKALVDAVAGRL